MAISPMFPQQSGGLQMLYSALDYQQRERLRKEAEAERKRQLEEQRRQQREANKHSAFGDTLKLIGTVGGAAVGSFTPVGPVGGAAIGSTLADATMAFAPNVGGTQPGADNPYYTPATDTQKALTAVNAGLQFYSAYEADKIAKERALAAADAKARSAEKLRATDFQTAQSYVTAGFDAPVDFAGSDARLQATGIETPTGYSLRVGSLARDLKDSGKYSFLKDEDFLMIAAGEADNYYKFGPTLDTLTLQGTELLYRALEQEGATAQSVLADLDAGETAWAREFRKLPVASQTAAKADLMKQSRATLASANAALKEQATAIRKDIQGRAESGLDRVYDRVKVLLSDESSDPPAGITRADLQGDWAADPNKMLTMLRHVNVQDPVEQYLALQRVYGGQETMIISLFPEDQRNIISGRGKTLGLVLPEAEAQGQPASEVGEADVSKRVDAQNNSVQAETSTGEQPASDTSQRQVEPLSEKETAQTQATEISNKQLLGLGSSLYSEKNNVDSGAPVDSTRYEKTRENYVARQEAKKEEDQTELAAEYLREQTVNPNAAVVAPKRTGGRPVNLSPEEARANFEAEKEARKTRSRRPGLAAEYQRDLALGEVANEDPPPPPPPESAINQMYEDQSVQKQMLNNAPSLISSDMDGLKQAVQSSPPPPPATRGLTSTLSNDSAAPVEAAPETSAVTSKEQAPEVSPLEQVLDLREAVDDKFQEINNKIDQAKAKSRQRGVRGEKEMESSLAERQAIYQTEAELSRIMTKFNSIEQQVMGQDSPSTRSPDTDQAYQDARDQYAELDQELAVLNTRLDKVLSGEQTSGRMMPRRGEDAAPDTAAPAEVSPSEVEPSAFETETLQKQINDAIRSYGKLSRGSGGVSGIDTVKENTSKAQALSLEPDALARAASWFDQQNFIPVDDPADNVSSLEFLLQQEINDLVLKAQYNDIEIKGSDELLGLNDHAARARHLLRLIEQIQGVNYGKN
jgi:hypothetical protein